MQKHTFYKTPRLFYCVLPIAFFCNSLFAGTINYIQHPAWDVGMQALYLKPSFSDGFAYLDDTTVAANTNKRNPLHTNWGWGFKMEGSYHFCPNSDLDLNWYHYKKSANGTFVFQTNPTADTYTVTPSWDAVNLEFGQSIHFDQMKNLRLHGGLQYAQIETTYLGRGIDPVTGPGTEYDFMEYTGVGPRIGADLSVGLMKCLSVYFGSDAAMLVGRSKFNFNETFEPLSISGSRTTVIVPEAGLKLGAKYSYAIPGSKLVFDAGYLLMNYFNVLHLENEFSTFETNFALNGWYAGIKWNFC